jgi:hypothetical protein
MVLAPTPTPPLALLALPPSVVPTATCFLRVFSAPVSNLALGLLQERSVQPLSTQSAPYSALSVPCCSPNISLDQKSRKWTWTLLVWGR